VIIISQKYLYNIFNNKSKLEDYNINSFNKDNKEEDNL
jgi:hypothetical protein